MLLDREELREALIGRRAGVARRLKGVYPSARALLAAIDRDHLSESGMPAAFVDSLHSSKGANTWNRYACVIGARFSLSARQGLPALPADPVRFACWLASTWERDRGYSQTEIRCCRRRISTPWSLRTATGIAHQDLSPRPHPACPERAHTGAGSRWGVGLSSPGGAQPLGAGAGQAPPPAPATVRGRPRPLTWQCSTMVSCTAMMTERASSAISRFILKRSR